MRLLLMAIGSRGDVQPLVALALKLRERGHAPTLAAGPNFQEWVRGLGLDFISVGPDVEAFTRAQGALINQPRKFVPLMISTITQATDELFRELPGMARGMDAILSGAIDMAGPSIAEWMGIPHVAVQFYPGLLPSAEWPVPLLPHYGLPHWLNQVSWVLGSLGDKTYFHRAVNGHRQRLGLAPFRGTSFDYMASGGQTLIATDPALSPIPADVRVPYRQTGFWFYEGGGEIPSDLEAFLEAGEPPVYLGFGSMSTADPERLTRLLVDSVRKVGCRALISTGWAGLGSVDLPETIRLVGAVSHAELFPRVAAVVHHGGAGTTAMAARSGKPQVVVPHLLDQYYWARRVELTGIGPRELPSRRLNSAGLAAALRSALEDASIQEAARRLAPILQARQGVEAAVRAIEALPRPVQTGARP